jgi:hypothetical protein
VKDCEGWQENSGKIRIKNALKDNTLRAYAEFLRRGRDSNLPLQILICSGFQEVDHFQVPNRPPLGINV